jgi:hypothetical protein
MLSGVWQHDSRKLNRASDVAFRQEYPVRWDRHVLGAPVALQKLFFLKEIYSEIWPKTYSFLH